MLTMAPSLQTDMGQMTMVLASPIHTVAGRQTWPGQTTAVLPLATTTMERQKRTHMDQVPSVLATTRTAVVTDRQTRPDQMIVRATTARLMIAIMAIPIHTAVATDRLVSPILMGHPVGTIMDLVLTPTTMAHMATGPQTTKAMARRQVKPVKTGSIKA